MNNRQLFQQYVGQTSTAPVAIEITGAKGNYLYGTDDKKWLDLIGGISVCNMGHGHPKVLEAIHKQADSYLHVMVYGELVQSPQVQYAHLLAQHLPATLNNVFFTNSGTEATEGALKLARRYTGRTDVICCNNSYHGSTLGALSIMGDEYWRNAFRPLLPGVSHYDFNSEALINAINEHTACVVLETIQAEAGVIAPAGDWLERVAARCKAKGALLILDEIQCGFGRTGQLWGFEHFNVVPDVVLLGKALGGGLPLGAFVSSQSIMSSLADNPVLGHITTFGGHPLSCAAGMAAMQALLDEQLVSQVASKAQLFYSLLHQHPAVKQISHQGLLMAVQLGSFEHVLEALKKGMEKGIFSDWFLFASDCIRIAPPLTITEDEIRQACAILAECM